MSFLCELIEFSLFQLISLEQSFSFVLELSISIHWYVHCD